MEAIAVTDALHTSDLCNTTSDNIKND
jgi:hypothetical protein